MKVKEVIKFLSEQNPEAELMVYFQQPISHMLKIGDAQVAIVTEKDEKTLND